MLSYSIGRCWLPALLAVALTACSLPPPETRSTSQAPPAASTADTRLGQGIGQLRSRDHAPPSHTGIYALRDAQEAFAARALLARAAERSLDVQYYIWRDDKTGQLLLHELLQAADRGVRVRLLLDDGGTSGLDDALRALDSHPQVQVRLFNPFALRGLFKLSGYVTDFRRTNRRMHNKSFTADNQASIVGGRNVGNEYFGATDGVLFADLDVLAAGPVVPDISIDFDRYWSSPSAYPIDQLVPHTTLELGHLRTAGAALLASSQAQDYRAALQRTPLVQALEQAQLPLLWAPTHLLSDDPAKILGQAPAQGLIGPQLLRALGQPQRQVDVVSPYFVPTHAGVQAFAALRAQGIAVRILTNAYEATDVAVVHSGYARFRAPLLHQGVEVFELRRQTPDYAAPQEREALTLNTLGSSGASLHAKTFAVDGQRTFIGSFNFDPRSIELNTEMGVLIESPALTAAVHQIFTEAVPSHAFRVSLTADGGLQWHSGVGTPPPVYDQEPGTRWLQRLSLKVLGWLPIEGLL